MKPIIYWIEDAAWRPLGGAEYEALRLRRGRLRVMTPDSIAYFYIEDGSQMERIYKTWNGGEGEIQLRLHLQDVDEPQVLAGVPKPETPPYQNPPFHLKLQFPTDALTFPVAKGVSANDRGR